MNNTKKFYESYLLLSPVNLISPCFTIVLRQHEESTNQLDILLRWGSGNWYTVWCNKRNIDPEYIFADDYLGICRFFLISDKGLGVVNPQFY